MVRSELVRLIGIVHAVCLLDPIHNDNGGVSRSVVEMMNGRNFEIKSPKPAATTLLRAADVKIDCYLSADE